MFYQKKISSGIGSIKRLRHSLPPWNPTHHLSWFGPIPLSDYCSVVWGRYGCGNLKYYLLSYKNSKIVQLAYLPSL